MCFSTSNCGRNVHAIGFSIDFFFPLIAHNTRASLFFLAKRDPKSNNKCALDFIVLCKQTNWRCSQTSRQTNEWTKNKCHKIENTHFSLIRCGCCCCCCCCWCCLRWSHILFLVFCTSSNLFYATNFERNERICVIKYNRKKKKKIHIKISDEKQNWKEDVTIKKMV